MSFRDKDDDAVWDGFGGRLSGESHVAMRHEKGTITLDRAKKTREKLKRDGTIG